MGGVETEGTVGGDGEWEQWVVMESGNSGW